MTKHSSSKRILQAVVPVLMLLLATSAWAASAAPSSGRGSLELQAPMTVAGTQLQTGKYRVEWTGSDNQVEVKILRGNDAVVTTHAQLVKDESGYDHVSYAAGEKGTKVLTVMSFGRQKCALHLETGSDAQQAAK